MKRVRVQVPPNPYDVVIEEGALQPKRLRSFFEGDSHGVVVSSRRVMDLHGDGLVPALRAAGFDTRALILLRDGEAAKTVREWERTLQAMAQARIDRSGFVVAFGGGSVGDAGGFAAATYMRGVRLIQIPTTLLSMVDSSVGGKSGLNLTAGKNLVGAFHQPRLVLADLRFLKTLPERERQSGVYEVLKCALLRSESLLRLLEKTSGLRTASIAQMETAIHEAVRIKARIVERDEKETGDRALLNLGHALGHALEAATAYKYFTHGEAVGYGIEFVADLGEGMDFTSPAVARRVRRAVAVVGPRRAIPESAIAEAGRAIQGDKKRQGATIREILLSRAGRAVLHEIGAAALSKLAEAWLVSLTRARSKGR